MSDKTHRLSNAPRSRTLLAVTAAVLLSATLAMSACVSSSSGPQKMVLATTTSTYDTGLLDYLIPKFDSKYNIKTKILSVGTGQALSYGQSGDADVLLVHSKAKELDFVAKGYGLWRKDVMYNWFMIVGPASDPAGVRSLNGTVEAFRAIANTSSTFCSRGDASGTNTKELDLWKKAGVSPDPKTSSWYLNLSQGMGETLITTNEKKGYTLTDEGTWWAMSGNLGNLQIALQGDKANLLNQYGVIPVNGSNGAHVNTKLGLKSADWIVSAEGQDLIARFERNGHKLFTPNAA
ncbi:MAG: hypothetical protein FJ149_08940 [Euryarchaeota archaeon]|nr:hypothetical protein [Euryarchaeota archaeon]